MALIQKSTSILFEENEEHSQILKVDSIFDFNNFEQDNKKEPDEEPDEEKLTQINEYIDEASQQANIEADLEEIEEKKEEKPDVEAQIQTISVLNEVKKSRVRRPSLKIKEINEKQDEDIKARQLERELTDSKAREQRKKEDERKKLLASVGSILSDSGNDSDASTATVGKKLIIANVRLETYNPTSQASMIFGSEFIKNINGETRCSLCGFKLKDRISYWHNKMHNPLVPDKLTWSYDHFVPVNFSAVVFRIPTSKSNFTDIEKEYLKNIGHIACYHCNYEKSQRMFITCPSKDFNNFQPNEDSIKLFVNDLYKSQNKNGWSKYNDPIKRTLTKCLLKENKHYSTWIRQRIDAIRELAKNVCKIIRENTDHSNIRKRHKLARIIIAKADQTVNNDERYNAISPLKKKKRNIFRRAYIANIFASAEIGKDFPKPWKQDTLSPMNIDPPDQSSVDTVSPMNIDPAVTTGPKIPTFKFDEKGNPIIEEGKSNPLGRQKQVPPVRRNPSLNLRSKKQIREKSFNSRKKGGLRSKRKTYRRIRLF
jgi:hypothetical protein